MAEMADRVYQDLIWQNPDRMSGAVCIYGTRLPVSQLLDYLEGGTSAAEFGELFGVPAERVRGVVGLLREDLDGWFDRAA